MAGHLPQQPPVDVQPDSIYAKQYSRDVWQWMKKQSDISGVKLSSYTITDHLFYPVDTTAGGVVGTLPPALGIRGRMVIVKKIAGPNGCTVAPAGSDTIDGGGAISVAAIGDSRMLISDGINKWYVIKTT